ncbi:hypothetical protein VaNZ11_001305 [Volvox africanus]|uniref:Uncharacterized protein n=1 Tax=Volvox africanus TaxID=51714 RepID=A0ABQ5RQX4_9CHLO|nr:hypothetical protein VaNZ11_001305 [Volvox africanus]
MAGFLDTAANVLGEVADYLKTEAAGLQQVQGPQEEREGRQEMGHETPSEGPPAKTSTDTRAGADTTAVALDGSSDSLYGPEGMNATAADISRQEGEAELQGGRQQEAAREEGGGPGDTLRGAREGVSQEVQRLKERFVEGYRDARDRMAGEEGYQEESGRRRGGSEEGVGEEGGLQETLRAAKARIDEENEQLKRRFHEGYQRGQETGSGAQ